MKKYKIVFPFLVIVLFLGFYFYEVKTSKIGTEEYTKYTDFLDEGYTEMTLHDYKIKTKRFGEVVFVPLISLDDNKYTLKNILKNVEGDVVYEFSDYSYETLIPNSIINLFAEDVNQNNFQDIILVIEYVWGAGAKSGQTEYVVLVYLQEDNGFEFDEEMNNYINEKLASTNFKEIKDLINNYNK